ncbi:36296_t:CDS:2 [Gigaspora margarita]|uniref:36296_t:CDS:1 n=1 Tax=Gigaspora margarita TaxID=4874 RepID=A0ABN7V5T0_GIGMA|nr:36296_t:CDS:2 [Gigaspora margarita]
MPLTEEIDSGNPVLLESCANVTSPFESEIIYDQLQKRDKRDRPVFDKVWKYIIKSKKVNPGHHNATCAHCGKFLHRGKPAILKFHLALHCQTLPPQVSTNYDEILLRAWVIANILFELLDEEVACVQNKIDKDLETAEYL